MTTVREREPGAFFAFANGDVLDMRLDRWLQAPTPEEDALLERVSGPALDVGCGPGRLTLALAQRGVATLGVDVSSRAVDLSLQRGATALQRCIFERVPAAGRWASALLLDGNIGIGGVPVMLLRRIHELLRAGGLVFVESERPGTPTISTAARLMVNDAATRWFPWARVAADRLFGISAASGFVVIDSWSGAGRWFACLEAQ